VTIAYLPPAAQMIRAQLHSLDFTETHRWHDIIKLYYTDQEVHTTSRSAVVVDFNKITAYQIIVGGETSPLTVVSHVICDVT